MLDALLFRDGWRTWSRRLTLRESSLNGLLQRCDLFVADPRDPPLFLLLDGSTSSGSAVPANPRSRLFAALAASWPSLVALPPAELLAHLGEELRRANAGSAKRMFASAVCLRPDVEPGAWQLAEAGDSKAFLYDGAVGNVVLPAGLPRPDHRTEGLLGTSGQLVRTAVVRPQPSQRLLLATDGAFHILVGATAATAEGGLRGDVLAAFSARGRYSEDDATLVLFEPHLRGREVP